MKEIYVTPEMEVVKFETEDIITASTASGDETDRVPIPGD